MTVNTLMRVIVWCVFLPGCNAIGDASKQLAEDASEWETTEVSDKLSGETVISAVSQQADEDNIVRGQLTLECRIPSKNMFLRLASFGAKEDADGNLPPLAFADVPQVRFRKSAPLSVDEVFVRGESPYNNYLELDLEETRLVALVRTFPTDPIAKSIGGSTEGAQRDVELITQSIARVERELEKALADSAKGPGACNSYIAPEDCLAHPARYREQLSGLNNDLARPSGQIAAQQQLVDSVKSRPDYARRVAFWTKVASQTQYSTLESLAQVSAVSAFMSPAGDLSSVYGDLYGDLYGATNAATFLEKLGPEVVFGYHAADGARNTVVLPLGNRVVSGVVNRCR